MTYLDAILFAKIAGTGLFVGLPFLLVPAARLVPLLKIEGAEAAVPLLRLYGWAVIALLVGYSFGFSWMTQGVFPLGVVTMGLVSNAGATLLLVLTGAWRRARAMTLFLGLIAMALGWTMARPELAMATL